MVSSVGLAKQPISAFVRLTYEVVLAGSGMRRCHAGSPVKFVVCREWSPYGWKNDPRADESGMFGNTTLPGTDVDRFLQRVSQAGLEMRPDFQRRSLQQMAITMLNFPGRRAIRCVIGWARNFRMKPSIWREGRTTTVPQAVLEYRAECIAREIVLLTCRYVKGGSASDKPDHLCLSASYFPPKSASLGKAAQ
jgi:hypothetical protein